MVRIAIVALELGRAFAEVLVFPDFGKAIVPLHRFPQTRCVYSNLVGKRLDRGRLNKIATPDELAPAASSRRDAAETVFLDEFTVTDEPRWNGGYCPLRAVHADDEFVRSEEHTS